MTGSRVEMPINLLVNLYSCVNCVDGTIVSGTGLPKHLNYVGSWIISPFNCFHRWDDWEQGYSTTTGPNDDIL